MSIFERKYENQCSKVKKKKKKKKTTEIKFFWEVKLSFHIQFKFSGNSNSVFVKIEDNFILIVSHLW